MVSLLFFNFSFNTSSFLATQLRHKNFSLLFKDKLFK
uniref:Uncharacterized protein n=1 Tax=Siphoviridae sp. ctLqe90 TaxID=2825456 RepID=A0A8S5Q3M4_9CAUD|nr:MAG TPA: hypothetical protein [Siphoviridae sp. ctLqe90]DAO37954.1 MAG TPA: hypothetical protein [Caudoviricetes sp.]